MSLTPSSMLPLGTPAPHFSLPDVVSGQTVDRESFVEKKALLVIFLCRHCPYVKHVQEELARLGKDYHACSVGIVAISSNDVGAYPDDAPPHLKTMAEELGFTFPVLYDERQEVAKAYHATCTPDFFLFNASRELTYRGQLDSSRPGNKKPCDGDDLRQAIEAVLTDQPAPSPQKPSLGCNIKWKELNRQ